MVEADISEKISQWQSNVRATLWNNYEQLSQDLQQFVNYIRLGEQLNETVIKLLKKSSMQQSSNLQSLDSHLGNLSPAAVKARFLFDKPQRYEVENKDKLVEDIKAIIELEELQLNFMDRALTANELLWLNQIASPNAFLRGWIYDVEEHSASRTEFIKVLNKVKEDRSNSLSVQVVKYKGRDSTPLNLFFLAGTDWVLQLTQSLSMLGQREIGVSLLLDKSEEARVFDLIKQYGDSSRLIADPNHSEILFLNL